MENKVEAEKIVDIKKQAKHQLGLKNKFLYTLLSLVSVLAILSVGVYASVNSFAVNLDNQITVELRNVSGVLIAKRTGGVLAEFDESGNTKKSSVSSTPAPNYEAVLFDIDAGGAIAENIDEFQSTKVNLSREYNSITYLFKYIAHSGTVDIDVVPTVVGGDADKVDITQKFCYAYSLPNWDVQGYTFNPSQSLRVSARSQDTIFIYVNVSIDPDHASFSIEDLDFSLDISIEAIER